KSISIVNDGVGSAGILVPAGDFGISIDAGPNDVINLRGLVIEGAGLGGIGIVFNTGKSLTIENCIIRNLTSSGIQFIPSVSATLAISNSLVADNSDIGDSGQGIVVSPNAEGLVLKVILNRVEVHNTYRDGIDVFGGDIDGLATGTIDITIKDSIVAGTRLGNGVFVKSGQALIAKITIVDSSIVNNLGYGVFVRDTAATARIGRSVIAGNGDSWAEDSGGTLRSYGDNYIDGNGEVDPVPTVIPKK
ncbi:MAG: hypothetical protein QOG83_300, partial [Alphaproteobacteria bacterium]|nr:hypothetical protein [Alphaproteobacteria bacterium]